MSKDYSHQFKQVPGQQFREVNNYTTELNRNGQAKHIETSRFFEPEKNRSIITISLQETQYLIEYYAGTGTRLAKNTEVIDFGFKIGYYVDRETGKGTATTRAKIHYGGKGAHMVPAPPHDPLRNEND